MGNCQAAEAATVVIQRPRGGGNNLERIYWSVSAGEVMSSNPGHYVAMVVPSPAAGVKQLKLLRRDDTLFLGQVYRLISFEDVLKEFAAKKNAKLGKLLKQNRVFNVEINKIQRGDIAKRGHHRITLGNSQNGCGNSNGRGLGRHSGGGGQWKPALHTITELGT